jgi:hypothetical protein
MTLAIDNSQELVPADQVPAPVLTAVPDLEKPMETRYFSPAKAAIHLLALDKAENIYASVSSGIDPGDPTRTPKIALTYEEPSNRREVIRVAAWLRAGGKYRLINW